MKEGSKFKLSRPSQYRLFLAVTLLGLIEGLIMAGAGLVVMYQLGEWLKHDVQQDPVGCLYTAFFNPKRAPAFAPLLLLSKNMGSTLLCLGVVVILLSNLGLVGSLYRRPLLVLFMLMMSIVIMLEVVSSIFILHGDSSINLEAKKVATMTLEDQGFLSNKERLDGPWMNGLHVLMVVLNCCGVDGPHDFTAMFKDKFVPETCCRRDFIREAVERYLLKSRNNTATSTTTSAAVIRKKASVGDHWVSICEHSTPQADMTGCTMVRPLSPGYGKVQKTKGCYSAIFDLIRSIMPWLMTIILTVLITQMSMVAGAMFVFNKNITRANCSRPPAG